MTIETGSELLSEFTEQAEKDGDHYLIAHFSTEDDAYMGHSQIDKGDALIIISKLIALFDLSPEAIGNMQ